MLHMTCTRHIYKYRWQVHAIAFANYSGPVQINTNKLMKTNDNMIFYRTDYETCYKKNK